MRGVWPSILLGCLPLAAAAAPIDKFITIQPIAVCDDLGLACADADGTLGNTVAVTNAVWAQAGIAPKFLPTRRFNETDYLTTTIQVSTAATDEGRRLLRTPGQQQSANPTTLNMYFVPDLRDGATNGSLAGFGFINGNGIIIGGAPRLDTLAHEIGHNLGLDHLTLGAGGPANVMTDGLARYTLTGVANVAPNGAGTAQLSAAQIAKAREPLFSVNQFALRVADGTVEIVWLLDGDSYRQERYYPALGGQSTLLPATQRALPDFTAWDDFEVVTWSASRPFVDPVPAPFSVLFEVTSGLTSQGFFDVNGVLSTLEPGAILGFTGEPNCGFVSSLRPDPDPAVEIAPAVPGLASRGRRRR